MKGGKSKMGDKVENMLVNNYEKYYLFAFSIVKKRDDALDVLQESAYKAMKNKKKLRKPEYTDTWIHRIILNTAMDLIIENQKKFPLDSSDSIDMELPVPEEGYEKVELENLLDCLSPKERGIVEMKYFEEMKLEDIAFITGENVNTVKSRLYRALDKLKKLF